MDSNNVGEQEYQNLVNNAAGKVGNVAKNGAKKVGKVASKPAKKLLKKTGKALGKAAVKLGKAAVKAVMGAVKAIIAFLGPIGLGILLLIILIGAAYHYSSNKHRVSGGEEYDPIYSGLIKYTLDADWDDRLKQSYYAMFSNYSYYYTIDDNKTLCQGNAGNITKDGEKTAKNCDDDAVDKFKREESFALSTTLLKFLDTELNDNIIYPQQFIRPVYNTCSTGESVNGKCELKPLAEHTKNSDSEEGEYKPGRLTVMSEVFEEFDCSNPLLSHFNDCSSSFKLDKDNKDVGIWDWGLAPILHYQSHEDKRYVKDYRIDSINYWDEDKKEYVTCKPSKCPEDIREKVTNKEKKNIDADKLFETKKKVYLIDQVATFLGTIKNDLTVKVEDTGDDYVTSGQIEGKLGAVKYLNTWNILHSKNRANKATKEDKEILSNNEYLKKVYVVEEKYVKYEPITRAEFTEAWIESRKNVFGNNFKPIWGDWNSTTYATPEDVLNGINYTKTNVTGTYNPGGITPGGSPSLPSLGTARCTSGMTPELNNDCTFYIEVQQAKTKSVKTCYNVTIVDNNTMKCEDDGTEMKLSADTTDIQEDGTEVKMKYYYFVSYQENHPTYYSMKGDWWTEENKYKTNNPDLESLNYGEYLKDYINNYETFAKASQIMNSDWNDLDEYKSGIKVLTKDLQDKTNLIVEEYEEEEIKRIKEFKAIVERLFGEKIITGRDDLNIIICNESNNYCEDEEDVELDDTDEGIGIQRNTGSKDYLKSALRESKLEEHIQGIAVQYGLDPDLLIAMIFQESSFKNTVRESNGSWVAGAGLMQIENVHDGSSVSALNNVTGKIDTVKIDLKAVSDPKTNIQIGAMILRNHINNYNGNIIMALAAYNMGGGNLTKIINAYTYENNAVTFDDLKNNPNNLGWLNSKYTSIPGQGDSLYVPHVLQYFYKENIEVLGKDYQGNIVFNVDKMKIQSDINGLTLDQQINWITNRQIILNNWKLLYGLDDDILKVKFNKENRPTRDTGDNDSYSNRFYQIGNADFGSQELINKTIATYFAMEDNGEIMDYMEVTNDMWREKFSSMFSNPGASELTLKSKDWSEYFSTVPSTPLQDVYSIERGYGYVISLNSTNNYQKEIYKDIVMIAPEKTKVLAVDAGTITNITADTITIQHKATSGDKKLVETFYGGIDIDESLKIGSSVSWGQKIGTLQEGGNSNDANDNNKYKNLDKVSELEFKLIVNNAVEDPSWIIFAAREQAEKSSMSIDGGAVGETNEYTKQIMKYVLEHADEIESEFDEDDDALFDENSVLLENTFDKRVGISSVAWERHYTSGGAHQGLDVYPSVSKTDTGVYNFTKGILVAFYDGFPDNGSYGNYTQNWGFANYVQMLYKSTNGNWFLVSYGHCQQGKEIHLQRYVNNPVLEKWTRIATIGNSGSSTGYHTHIQIQKYGRQSLKQIMEFLVKNQGKYASLSGGKNYKTPGTRCENTSATPCWQRPDLFFNAKDGHHYNGIVPRREA